VDADFLDGTPRESLLRQLTEPVLWIQSVNRLLDEGVRQFVEVGPGDALKGMIERITKNYDDDVSIYNTDTLDNTQDVIEAIK
jgi:[acyl-carrier-protein] S-malonyltransferase